MGKMSHLAKMSHLTTLRHESLCAVSFPAVSHFLIWGADYLCANSGGRVSTFSCMFLFSLILYTESKSLILSPLLLSAWTTGMHHCP